MKAKGHLCVNDDKNDDIDDVEPLLPPDASTLRETFGASAAEKVIINALQKFFNF